MRRHLGYTPAEVNAMPWYETQMWHEMLTIEFGEESDSGDEPEVEPGRPPLRDVSSSVSRANIETSLDELAGFGMNVRKVG